MSPASVFSLCRPARAPHGPVGAFRPAARLPLTLLAAAALVGGATLRADDTSPGSLDTSFAGNITDITTYTVRYEAESTTQLGGISTTPLIFVGGDNGNLDVLFTSGVGIASFVDPDFGGPNRLVYVSALERVTDPGEPTKILVGGVFGKSADQIKANEPGQNIFRLTPEGVIDTTFDPGKGANDYVTSIVPLADGRVVIGGLFDEFNKESHKHIVRIERDGAVDESFADGLRIDDSVLAVAEQLDPATGTANGSIIIAGTFGSVGGQTAAKLARLDSNGVLDTTFKPVIDLRVLAVAVQPDGKIIIGGDFTNVNGTNVSKIARLNYDGSLDTTFSGNVAGEPAGEPNPVAVYVIKLLPLGDGRLYVAGNFTQYDGTTRNYLARVNPDGSLDTTFDPGTSIIQRVQDLDIQPDNKVLVAEQRGKGPIGHPPASVIRLNGDPVVPSVGLVASKPIAKELVTTDGSTAVNGKITFSRDATNLTNDLTVYVKLGGTATQGVDYKTLKLQPYNGAADGIYSFTFPAGVSSVTIHVHPKSDGPVGTKNTVELTLVADQTGARSYTLSSGTDATVTIKVKEGHTEG